MSPRWRALLAALAAVGCGGAAQRSPTLVDLDRSVSSPVAREVQRDAPEAYAEVARAVRAAEDAAHGPADVLASRAMEAEATLAWAATQARGNVARRRVSEAERRRHEAEIDAARMEQQAGAIDQEIAGQVRARDALAHVRTATSGPNAVPLPERSAAAAETRQQAELLVASAVLLGASESARTAAQQQLRAADDAATRPDATAALVAAGRAYLAAEALVRETRAGSSAPPDATDAARLVTDLSGAGNLEPRRDARGVIAVMRGLFAGGSALAPASRGRVESIARVIQGHADARVRIEAFAGGADRARAERTAQAQAQAVVQALVRAGVPQPRLQPAGLYRVPGGARTDDRVEVVLVLPGEP